MENEKMREKFEEFRDKRNALLESEGHKPGSKWHITQAHYATWQASRESLVIDLEPDEPADEGAAYLHQDFVKERIEATGLKVKP